jgi:DNA-binding MarR family transcriptional regulator
MKSEASTRYSLASTQDASAGRRKQITGEDTSRFVADWVGPPTPVLNCGFLGQRKGRAMTEPVRSYMSRERRLTAMRIGNAIAPLHRLDGNMHMRVVLMFLLVGQEDGLAVSELGKRCGVGKNAASRYLSDLGTTDRYGKPGLGLVTMVQRVYGDRRERHVYLTERGLDIAEQIRAALTEARPRKRF